MPNHAYCSEGSVFVHFATGRLIDRLAAHCDTLFLSMPMADGPPPVWRDYGLHATNIQLINQPYYQTLRGALKHIFGIFLAYVRVCRHSTALFIRDMCPFLWILYSLTWIFRCKVVHEIVSNPLAILRSGQRRSWLHDTLSLIYAWHDRLAARVLGRWLAKATFLCCGHELRDLFRSPRTIVTVATAITEDELFEREDTCRGSPIRILFVGAFRPEKGVEYLIEAAACLTIKQPWQLVLVGSRDQFSAYHHKLTTAIERHRISRHVRWCGYVPYGPLLFQCFRNADVFVLPSLSEGTPRVLVEARAHCVPVVATNVGGIPTTITDRLDGILVPPKDSTALAQAIDRIVADGELRRALIRAGFKRVRSMTIDRFVATVLGVLHTGPRALCLH